MIATIVIVIYFIFFVFFEFRTTDVFVFVQDTFNRGRHHLNNFRRDVFNN